MRNSDNKILKTLSYVAFLIIALLIAIRKLLPLIGITGVSGPAINILETVQNVFILIVIGLFAFNFTAGKAKWIKILFWVAAVIFVVGTVLAWL